MRHLRHPRARSRHWLALTLATSLTMVGCATTTVMHYDLTASKSVTGPAATPSIASQSPTGLINYQLQSVTVPEPLDVMTLMVRQPNNSLMVLSHDKWVASLGQVMQQAIADGLTQALGVPPLTGQMRANETNQAANNAQGVTEVTVDIRQFEMQPAKQATLTALWQVTVPKPRRLTINCFSQLTEPVASGVAPLVSAQQANVLKLTQQIARVMATANPIGDARCRVMTP